MNNNESCRVHGATHLASGVWCSACEQWWTCVRCHDDDEAVAATGHAIARDRSLLRRVRCSEAACDGEATPETAFVCSRGHRCAVGAVERVSESTGAAVSVAALLNDATRRWFVATSAMAATTAAAAAVRGCVDCRVLRRGVYAHCSQCRRCYVGAADRLKHCDKCNRCCVRGAPHRCWSASAAATDCAVCLDAFVGAAAVLELDCGHLFHRHCLVATGAPHICPLCRAVSVPDARLVVDVHVRSLAKVSLCAAVFCSVILWSER